MNTSNGALITKYHERFYVCDLENYQGTYILDEDGGMAGKAGGLMWFAAPHGGNVYYSNQKDNDYLYCLNTESLSETRILKRPCGFITVFADNLFFLDETDSLIYEFDLKTDKIAPAMQEKVTSFILCGGVFYCSSSKGLLEFDLRSRKSARLTEHIPLCLSHTSCGVVFADTSRDFSLSILEQKQSEPKAIGSIKTQSLVAGEDYVYAANLQDNRSIVRLSLSGSDAIRFCGEKADKLHIIDDYLYYQNQNDKNAWYKMPLSGGRSVRLLAASL